MATVVNNPSTTSDSSSMSWVIGLIVVVALFFLLFYGLPLMRGSVGTGGGSGQPAVQQSPQSGGSESKIDVKVPDKVDINTGQ